RSGWARRSPRPPVEVFVDLAGALQVLELLEPGEGARGVRLGGKLDPLEQPPQLLGALLRSPLRREARQLRGDLVEGYPIAAVVPVRHPDRDLAPREGPRHALGDLADPIVLAGAPHVEDLTVDGGAGRLDRACHRLADVLDVRDGPPG